VGKLAMKRYLCPKHIVFLVPGGKPILLDSKKCSVCKFNARKLNNKQIYGGRK